jgi:glycosidase
MQDPKPKTFGLPDWAKNAVIYEVNLRQYTPQGTINAFSDHIPRLKEMGVDVLWLMPVFPISKSKRKGTLGSYYAVSDFRQINPEFGTDVDMKNLIEKIHAYKMKVIIDWVPNHTGWDHTWLIKNPDYYTKGKDGKVTDPLDDKGVSMGWADVADLNYENKNMRAAMIDDLLYWLKDYKVDGFRMDVAWGVPLDFWKTCADTMFQSNNEVFLLAEAEIPDQLNQKTFHAAYGWTLHHTMNAIAKGEKNTSHLDEWLSKEKPKYVSGSLMHFITNHDENSWNGTEMERMGEAYKTFAVFAMTFDGIPLIYSGQEEPLERRLQFFEKDDIKFKDYKLQSFYSALVALKHQEKALWNEPHGGAVRKLGSSAYGYAFKREKENSKVVVMTNFSKIKTTFAINEDVHQMMDVFTKQAVSYNKGDVVSLEPLEYKVLIKK